MGSNFPSSVGGDGDFATSLRGHIQLRQQPTTTKWVLEVGFSGLDNQNADSVSLTGAQVGFQVVSVIKPRMLPNTNWTVANALSIDEKHITGIGSYPQSCLLQILWHIKNLAGTKVEISRQPILTRPVSLIPCSANPNPLCRPRSHFFLTSRTEVGEKSKQQLSKPKLPQRELFPSSRYTANKFGASRDFLGMFKCEIENLGFVEVIWRANLW